jgi:hypothetical protein
LISYTASLREADETIGLGQNAARVRRDLEDVLARVREAGYRPVLILDDTEKFVSPGRDGKLDEASIENLYHHGVRLLGELHRSRPAIGAQAGPRRSRARARPQRHCDHRPRRTRRTVASGRAEFVTGTAVTGHARRRRVPSVSCAAAPRHRSSGRTTPIL